MTQNHQPGWSGRKTGEEVGEARENWRLQGGAEIIAMDRNLYFDGIFLIYIHERDWSVAYFSHNVFVWICY